MNIREHSRSYSLIQTTVVWLVKLFFYRYHFSHAIQSFTYPYDKSDLSYPRKLIQAIKKPNRHKYLNMAIKIFLH